MPALLARFFPWCRYGLLALPLLALAWAKALEVPVAEGVLPGASTYEISNEGLIVEHHRPVLDRWTRAHGNESMVVDSTFARRDWHACGVSYFGWHLSTARLGYPAGTAAYWKVSLDFWLFAVLASLPLAIYAFYRLRRARRGPTTGHCAGCGYDLRASPARCPECGRAVKPSVGSSG